MFQRIVAGLKACEFQIGQADSSCTRGIQALSVRSWSHWLTSGPEELFPFIPPSVTALTLHLPAGIAKQDVRKWKIPLGIQTARLQALTSLELSFGTFSEISSSSIFSSLQHCTNLETLTLDFASSAISHPDSDAARYRFTKTEVILPKLRSLSLPQFNGGYLDTMKILKMPVLQELSVSFELERAVSRIKRYELESHSAPCQWDEAPGAKDLIEFVHGDPGTESQLRFLHIKAMVLHTNFLYHLLRDLRFLTHMKLEWVEFCSNEPDGSFTNLMTHAPPCLPDLKVIELLDLKHSRTFKIPSLRALARERNIELTVSYDYWAAMTEKYRIKEIIQDDEESGERVDPNGYDSDKKPWDPDREFWDTDDE